MSERLLVIARVCKKFHSIVTLPLFFKKVVFNKGQTKKLTDSVLNKLLNSYPSIEELDIRYWIPPGFNVVVKEVHPKVIETFQKKRKKLKKVVLNYWIDNPKYSNPSIVFPINDHINVSYEEKFSKHLFVKTLTKKTLKIPLPNLNATIEDLKVMIENEEYIYPDCQRLIFAGKECEDGRTLNDYRCSLGCTFHLVLRLRSDVKYVQGREVGKERFDPYGTKFKKK